jgi:ribosome-binding protein aMBF1 (putative translation factor)
MTRFGRRLIESAREALAIARGKTKPARIVAIDAGVPADEDAADIAVYDAAKAEFEAGGSVAFTPELSALVLKHKSRLTAVRKWRGLSQEELAAKADIQQGYLSDLETGRRNGAPATIERLAKALDVDASWLD